MCSVPTTSNAKSTAPPPMPEIHVPGNAGCPLTRSTDQALYLYASREQLYWYVVEQPGTAGLLHQCLLRQIGLRKRPIFGNSAENHCRGPTCNLAGPLHSIQRRQRSVNAFAYSPSFLSAIQSLVLPFQQILTVCIALQHKVF